MSGHVVKGSQKARRDRAGLRARLQGALVGESSASVGRVLGGSFWRSHPGESLAEVVELDAFARRLARGQ